MIDTVRKILIIVLIVILVFAFFYSIVKLIIKPSYNDVENTLITSTNIKHIKKDEYLVKSYNIYYYLEACFKNFIESCKNEKFDDLYDLYIDKYYNTITKKEVMDELESLNLNLQEYEDDIKYKIGRIYEVDGDYILEIVINNKEYNLIMQINENKDSDYYFAFVK